MKHNIVIFATGLTIFSNTVFGQDLSASQIPSEIMNHFKDDFPRVSDIKWKMDGKLFKADFDTGILINHVVWYDHSGHMIKHREEIFRKTLPEPIVKSLQRNFSGFTIEKCEKFTSEDAVFYIVEILNSRISKEVVYTTAGDIIQERLV